MATTILNFVANTKGIDDSITALEKAGKVSTDTAKLFNKDEQSKQAELAKTGKVATYTAAEGQKLLDKMKAIPANLGNKAYQEVQKSLEGIGKGMTEVVTKSASLRQQLKQNTQALAELEIAGKRNTDQYKELLAQTGELKDALSDTQTAIKNAGSDTKNIEGVIGIARGAAAAYNLAAASAQIFGDDNKDLQATLLKTQVAMQLLLGIQELGNLVQKESIAVQFISNGQKKLATALTYAETAAESQSVIVRGAATVAQRLLNAAMMANPIALLIGAIVALVGAFAAYEKIANGAANTQIHLNEVEAKSIEISKEKSAALDHETEAIKQRTEAMTKQLELDNKGLEAVIAQEKKGFAERNAINQKFFDDTKKELSESLKAKGVFVTDSMSLEELRSAAEAKIIQNDIKLRDDSDAKRQASIQQGIGISNNLAAKIRTVFTGLTSAQKEALDGTTKNLKEQISLADKALKDTNALGQEGIEQDKKDQLLLIENAKARYETIAIEQLAANKKLSDQRLNAEKAALAEAEKLELENASLSLEQIALVQSKYREAQRQLNAKYAIDRINDQRKAIDAELQTQIEGSQNQLALKLLDLDKQKQAELRVLHLTDNEKLDIEAKFQKQRSDLIADYNMQVSLRQLAAEKVTINAKTALEKEGAKTQLADKLELIDIEQQEQLVKARDSYDKLKISFAEYETELTRINSDAVNKRYEAEKEFKAKQIALQQTDIANVSAHEKAMNELRKNSYDTNIFAKQAATQKEFDIENNRLRSEKILLDKQLDAKLISEKEYQAKKQQIDDEIAANTQAKSQQQFQYIQQQAQEGLKVATEAINAAIQYENEERAKQFQLQEQRLQMAKAAELNQENLSQAQKNAINNKYAKQENALKKQQWEAEKEAKLTQALINGALAITNVMATLPPPAWLVAIPAAIASTAIQVAVIESQKAPAFAKGVVNLQGAGTETSDSIPAYLSKGESVITAQATRKYTNILQAMNKGTFDFQMPDLSQSYVTENNMVFDYDKFGEKVAEKLKANPQALVSVDKNGVHAFLVTENSRTEIVNNRITFR